MANEAKAERNAIVAWLREPIFGGDHMQSIADTHAEIAEAIERGEHLAQADRSPKGGDGTAPCGAREPGQPKADAP